MINGIIITTFSQLREDNEKKQSNIEDACYICGNTRDDFERDEVDFKLHMKTEHNYMNYLRFLISITMKEFKELNAEEGYIFKSLDDCTIIGCYPLYHSLALGNRKKEEIKG